MTCRSLSIDSDRPFVDAHCWLPTDDPAAGKQIDALFRQISALGLDPVGALRDAITRWFGHAAAAALPAPNPHEVAPEPLEMAGTLAHMLLPTHRRPTLWPQRPRRQPGELFSSWLRRAAIAAGATPQSFAREMLGPQFSDADRAISEIALQRLAIVSGQRCEFLAAGALIATNDLADPEIAVQNTALKIPGLNLGHPQFCPLCLVETACPRFPRRWCFAYEAVCSQHECWLRSGCPECRTPIEKQPTCWACGYQLVKTSISPVPGAAKQQRALTGWLSATACRGDLNSLQKSVQWLAAKLFRDGRSAAARRRVFETDLFSLLAEIPDRRFHTKSRQRVAGKRILAASSPALSNQLTGAAR
jgi:hypothetical protein